MTTSTISASGFSPKDPAEVITIAFDFTALTTGPISPVVACTRNSGTADASPSALLSGAPTVSGSKILQRIVGGVAGCTYLMRCQVDTADGSRYVLAGLLPVRAA